MPRPPTGDSSTAAAAVFEIMPIRALYGNDPQAEDRCCVLSREYSDEPVLSELIDHIGVYETQGTGKIKPSALSFTASSSGIGTLTPRRAIRTTLPTSARVAPLSMFPASRRTV